MSWLLHRSLSMKGIEENEVDTELNITTGAVILNPIPDTDMCMYVCMYIIYGYTYRHKHTHVSIYIHMTHAGTHTQHMLYQRCCALCMLSASPVVLQAPGPSCAD